MAAKLVLKTSFHEIYFFLRPSFCGAPMWLGL